MRKLGERRKSSKRRRERRQERTMEMEMESGEPFEQVVSVLSC